MKSFLRPKFIQQIVLWNATNEAFQTSQMNGTLWLSFTMTHRRRPFGSVEWSATSSNFTIKPTPSKVPKISKLSKFHYERPWFCRQRDLNLRRDVCQKNSGVPAKGMCENRIKTSVVFYSTLLPCCRVGFVKSVKLIL